MLADMIAEPLGGLLFFVAWLVIGSLGSLIRTPRIRRSTFSSLDKMVRVLGGLIFGYLAVVLGFPIDSWAAGLGIPFGIRTSFWFGCLKLLPGLLVSTIAESGLVLCLRSRMELDSLNDTIAES
ncbi:MAG: hypothetical protein AAFU85_13875 [Planctomycetota bacterium]